MSELVNRIRDGDRLALARLLTQLENDPSAALADSNALYRFAGQAHLVGVTGSPGTGKSSLVNRLALELRKDGKKNSRAGSGSNQSFQRRGFTGRPGAHA